MCADRQKKMGQNCTMFYTEKYEASVKNLGQSLSSLYYESWSCFPLESEDDKAGGFDEVGCDGGAVRA